MSPGMVTVYVLLGITVVSIIIAIIIYQLNWRRHWFNPWTHRYWYRLGLLPLIPALLIYIYHISGFQPQAGFS